MSSIITQSKCLQGPAGDIDAIIEWEPDNIQGVAVCCHPHPVYGGSMTNKVIYTVARSLVSQGFASIRFNFRGVGKSEGQFDNGVGEKDDLRAVISWAQKEYDNLPLVLGGFSFGSFISSMIAHEYHLYRLISVAPPIERFDFTGFQQPKCPWDVFMGNEDEVVSFKDTEEWIHQLDPMPNWQVMNGAGHFFHGRLVELRERIISSWLIRS